MDVNRVDVIQRLMGQNARVFRIPVYQRNYDWSHTECKKLFDDIIESLNKNKKHFLGTFVYIVNNIGSGTINAFIIDGQQRFTTLYVMLKAMYDVVNIKNEENGDSLRHEINEFLFNRYCDEIDDIQRLRLSRNDDKVLKSLMKGETYDLPSDSNIVRNYEYIKKRLMQINIPLRRVLDGMKNLEMVEISLNRAHGDDPQVIFESINSTGMALQKSDLIRNFLLMDDERQEQLFENYWLPTEQILKKENIEDFVFHYIVAKINRPVKKSELYEVFKELCSDHFGDREEALKDIKKYARYYSALIGTDNPNRYDKDITDILGAFNYLNQTTIFPFFLRILNDFDARLIDRNDLIDVLTFMENYVVRRIICDVSSNTQKSLYGGLYERVFDGENTKNNYYRRIYTYFDNLRTKDKIPGDIEFRNALENSDLYNKPTNICKYLMVAIENSGNEKIDISSLTIEHILPQTPDKVWETYIGDDYENVYEKYVHTLGNLTITGFNSELGRKSFKEKQKLIYEKSKAVLLNKDILSVYKWGEDEIIHRAQELSKILLKLFSVKKTEKIIKDSNQFIDLSIPMDFTYKPPVKIRFLSKTADVRTYKDVLRQCLTYIYKDNPKTLESLAERNYAPIESSIAYLSFKNTLPTRVEKLCDTDIYFYHGLSANALMRFIRELLLETGYSTDDFGILLNYNSGK